jgi:hypothetical protein
MMTPDGTAFVLTSASSRGGVPSEKIRFPVPNTTGKTSSKTSSASSCSSSTGVSVELPQTIRCGPLFALIRRTPSTISGPRPSAGPHPRLSGLWACCLLFSLSHSCATQKAKLGTPSLGSSVSETSAPRPAPGRRRQPYGPRPVPRSGQRLSAPKNRLCAPWSPGTARR